MRALNDAGVRYLIAGGPAVVAYGHVRLTAGVDIVVDLEGDNVRRAIAALSGLGHRPRAPVSFAEFADPVARSSWAREKGMTVFSVYGPQHPVTEVDLFLEPPFDFGRAYPAAERFEIASGLVAPNVGYADLVDMKRKAGRPQDLQDIEHLEANRRSPGTEP